MSNNFEDVFNEDDDDELKIGEKSWERVASDSQKDGLREGISDGKDKGLQQGFDQGYSKGYQSNFPFGLLRGILGAMEAYTSDKEEDGLGQEIAGVRKQVIMLEKNVHSEEVEEEEFLAVKQKTLQIIENLGLSSLYETVQNLTWSQDMPKEK